MKVFGQMGFRQDVMFVRRFFAGSVEMHSVGVKGASKSMIDHQVEAKV